jgi:hypothetical protein
MDTQQGIALGVWVRGFPTDPDAVDRYRRLTGHSPAVIHLFRNWTDATGTFDPALADAIAATDAVPMISWQPPAGDLAAGARGEHDAYVQAYAAAVAAWGGRLLLRPAHEMNGEWIPWRSDPAAFREAWHRLRWIFAEEGASNAIWVWSPHVIDRRAADFAPYFPGADAVDWLALDGYNWGRSQRSTRWQSFDAIFADSYRRITDLAPDLPVMLAEIGCAEEGGDKAAWIRDALLDAVPNRYPAVRCVAWFHDAPTGHADWRVDSSPEALTAWREVAADARYEGRIGAS